MESRFDRDEVIEAGHPPVAEGVVCVDFDGTIFPFGTIEVDDEPLPGAAEAVRELRDRGYTIVIFSSRFSKAWHDHEGWDHDLAMLEQKRIVQDVLRKHNIPWDHMTAEKIPALAYFDDKAYEVRGPSGLASAVEDFIYGRQ